MEQQFHLKENVTWCSAFDLTLRSKVTRDNLTDRNGVMTTLKEKYVSSDKIKRLF